MRCLLCLQRRQKKRMKAKEKQRERDEIDIENSGDESCGEQDSYHGNAVLVQEPTKGYSSSRSVAAGGTTEKFYKPPSIEESVQMMHKDNISNKIQTTLTTQKRQERRDRTCEKKDGKYIFELVDKCIEDIGEENVVQLVTDNANNKKELTRLFRSDEQNELGYLKKAKGKKANKVVKSECFWKNVDNAVNFFKPLANVLRRMDSDIPAMGFFHGLMLEAKKQISERFDNDESRFKVIWDIIDKRWDSKLKTPLHLASYYLNPYFYYPKKSEIEHDGSFRAGVIECITVMVEEEEIQDNIIEELNTYQDQRGTFGHEIAIRQRENKNF
ncbi:hypothetical protein U9M48_029141 [Paspalum notatum var. saurae]|uniref:DUF659 domain-containing protein n=1 Tax=Paspalum notatum var. saurae TaxID=547442 RepID=A0AAQ3U2E4_PASNO